MSLTSQVSSALVRIGTEFKTVYGQIGSLAALTTTNKSTVVAAINEVKAAIGSGGSITADSITDATVTGKALVRATDAANARSTLGVYSTSQTDSAISTATSNLVNSAPSTMDTLKELSDALGADPNFATTMSTALGNRVRVDTASQGLTGTQQQNARTNIDVYGTSEVGSPTTDFVAVFNSALL